MITENNQQNTTKKRLNKRVQKVSSKIKGFGAKLRLKETAHEARVMGIPFKDKDFHGNSIFEWDIVRSYRKLEKQFRKLEKEISRHETIDPKIAQMLLDLPQSYQVVRVENDAMYPTIKKGGYAIIDSSKRDIEEALHAINYNGRIKIKRLQFDMDGTVEVFTDSKTSLDSYRETITKKQLAPLIAGRVIRIIH